jgi:hypothetical protein
MLAALLSGGAATDRLRRIKDASLYRPARLQSRAIAQEDKGTGEAGEKARAGPLTAPAGVRNDVTPKVRLKEPWSGSRLSVPPRERVSIRQDRNCAATHETGGVRTASADRDRASIVLEHRADFMKRHDVHDALFYFLFFRATAP